MNIKQIFNRPKLIGVVGNVSEGKSMLLYNLIEQLNQTYSYNLYYYGLRVKIPDAQEIFTVRELESIQNSIIIIDEFETLFDLDDRKKKRLIENTLRLIQHNNNIIILSGNPYNFKKFISAKINEVFYKTCTLSDFINGSLLKHNLTSYYGSQRGSELLKMAKNEVLYYDGKHYSVFGIDYLDKYDTKKNNPDILKKCGDK